MSRYYLSLGSNINRYLNLTAALDALQENYGEIVLSPMYESASVGFAGAHFLNNVVGIETQTALPELAAQLKQIEADNGRVRNGEKFSGRTLDIDILTCDNCCGVFAGITLPREEILFNAYVLKPLADIAGDEIHPAVGQSYRQLWQAYDHASQPLQAVPFRWHAITLPMPE